MQFENQERFAEWFEEEEKNQSNAVEEKVQRILFLRCEINDLIEKMKLHLKKRSGAEIVERAVVDSFNSLSPETQEAILKLQVQRKLRKKRQRKEEIE